MWITNANVDCHARSSLEPSTTVVPLVVCSTSFERRSYAGTTLSFYITVSYYKLVNIRQRMFPPKIVDLSNESVMPRGFCFGCFWSGREFSLTIKAHGRSGLGSSMNYMQRSQSR